MIDYHPQLISALSTILPTHYEMVLSSKTKTPCITYLELNNFASETGDTIGYSHIQYQIKIWGNEISKLQEYAQQIDDTLRSIGWKRINSGELYDKESTMIQKILTYEALASENF